MKKEIENLALNLKAKKAENKSFYNSFLFWEIEKEISIHSSQIIVDPKVIQWIDSIFEMNRDIIYFKPYQQYSLVYNDYIIEKYYNNKIIYIIHNKKQYLNKLKNL